jgi:hypothetical protein
MANEILKEQVLKVHAYMLSKNLNIQDLLFIQVANRDGLLNAIERDPNQQVVINYDTLKVNFVDNSFDQDFVVNMFVDRAVYESMIIAMEDDVNFFNGNLMAIIKQTIIVRDSAGIPILDNDGNETTTEIRVPVYSFVNSAEVLSTDPMKSVRIQTLYGPGYIGLVDVPYTDGRDNYTIVVEGSNGDPLIKYFEVRNT